jgi:putative transposase
MILVEIRTIKKRHTLYVLLDRLLFLSKNLYNSTLYAVRNHYFQTGKYLNYNAVNKIFTDGRQQDYRALPAKASKLVQTLVDQNFKSFFALLRKKAKGEYDLPVNIPRYLDKIKGRQVLLYTSQALKRSRKGFIGLSGTDIWIKTDRSVKFIRLVPKNGAINIEIGYEAECRPWKAGATAAMDLGLNNLGTIAAPHDKAFIINGKPLKAINQYYNKKLAKEKSFISRFKTDGGGKRKFSNKIQRLRNKRNNKIKDYMHKASRMATNYLVSKGVSDFIIGYDKGWKQDVNIGKKTNQKFVQTPFKKFIDMLVYKCGLEGISVRLQEESYTSKCSFFDNEPIRKHLTYRGKRVKRGLFKTSQGLLLNADVNGALNILKKHCQKVAWNDAQSSDYVEARSTPLVSTIKY